MLGLVLRAIRRRRVQAALLFLLATAAATGAAAAPGYIATSAQDLAVSAISSARPGERVVAVSRSVPVDPEKSGEIDSAISVVREQLVLPGFQSIEDVRISGRIDQDVTILAFRVGACEQIIIIDGACPLSPGDVAVSAALGQRLELRVGDAVPFESDTIPDDPDATRDAAPLRATAIFVARAPFEPYWGRSAGTPRAPVPGERLAEEMLLTPRATFAALGAESVTVAVDLIATPESFRETDPQVLALAAEQGAARLTSDGYEVASELRALADRIWLDQRLVLLAVPIGAVQLLVLCWFALFLAVRQTSEERQPDVAKLKLHGVRRRDIWALAAGQITLPLLGGGLAGFALGTGLSQALSGAPLPDAVRRQVLLGAVGATALAVAGAIVAALLAERRLIQGSVVELGRRIQDRRGGLRTGIVEVAVFTVTLAAAYQIGRQSSAATESRGLALAAPLLMALAIALVAARLVPVLANASANGLLRSGRVGAWLVALNLARRPGQFRVLALLSLAVAVFCGAAFSWHVSSQARADRVALEVGADRVVTVQADGRASLLAAVRDLDPERRYAMAAVQTFGTLPTLAVDVDRLASVTHWQAGYGAPAWDDLVALLRPETPKPLAAAGDRLRLDATWRSDATRVRVVIGFATHAGAATTAEFGPLRPGRHQYEAPLAGCTSLAPCRLASITVTPVGATAVGPGNSVVLHSLSGAGPVVDSTAFVDRTRWRNDVTAGANTPLLSTTEEGLAITDVAPLGDAPSRPMAAVYPLDAPIPLPVLTAGSPLMSGEVGDPRLALLGSSLVPVRVVDQASVMPRLGTGVVVDLEYADRVLPAGTRSAGLFQVWLGPDAPADVLDRLEAAGLSVIAVDSAAGREAGLSAQGPPVAVWFLLLVSAGGLLLALGTFAVWTAAERTGRASELAALRRQGLSQRSARVTALGGYLTFVVVAAGVGVLMALTLRRFQALPIFADDWTVLATPELDVGFAGVAIIPAAVVLVGAAIIAGMALLRAVRRPGGIG